MRTYLRIGRSRLLMFTLLLPLGASCTTPPLQVVPKEREQVPEAPRELPRVPAPNAAAAEVPDGYRVEVVVKDLTYPSCVEFDSAGNLYVAEAGYVYGDEAAPARVWRISGAGEMRVLTEHLSGPITGLLWHDGRLLVSHKGKISTIGPDGSVRDLVTGLPSSGDHFNNQLALGPDGKIYFGQGVVTNAGVVGVDNFVFGWLGKYPSLHDVPAQDIQVTGQEFVTLNPLVLTAEKPPLVRTGVFAAFGTGVNGKLVKGQTKANGTILRMNPDGSNLEVYAWGLRNPFGLAFGADGKLYAADNGYDDRGSRPVANAPDVIWQVREGAWYGWPDYVGGEPITDSKFRPPGKPALQFLMRQHPPVEKPFLTLPKQTAVTQMAISRGGRFGFESNLFVGAVGDMSPVVGSSHPVGYQVLRIDPATRKAEPFFRAKPSALGPTQNNLEYVQTAGPKRIVGLRFSPQGDALYVADIGAIAVFPSPTPAIHPYPGSGVIWRITRGTGNPGGPPAGLSPLPSAAGATELGRAATTRP
jgi:glucose/arabinose dehydrogenase